MNEQQTPVQNFFGVGLQTLTVIILCLLTFKHVGNRDHMWFYFILAWLVGLVVSGLWQWAMSAHNHKRGGK